MARRSQEHYREKPAPGAFGLAVVAPGPEYGPGTVPPYKVPPAEVVAMVCAGLPATLRGIAEVVKVLRWNEDFVRYFAEKSLDAVPRMPVQRSGGTLLFYTGLLVRWHLTYFDGGKLVTEGKARERGRRRGVKSESEGAPQKEVAA